ncbi:exodeoxyribonuclease VII small subunit [Luteolibacter flavescens]|uniref:Exodeoxyribonuclease 7 small subunit n=1 Tax=Luteolibacter flavescens TaxID=1859460 RepID=A0ABT3FMK1_9BACT|nr:exodeoxyribonuclease VII small subunit [Luteolibacter flavescens]MCW1884579.1 exodeoxyribonuclease VII small subunit [Luteolibacter flavescens]
MPARKKTPDAGQNGDNPSFEAALAELEEIVAAMEEEQLPLEELVSRYEKGSKLLARCETVLASARKRLQTISARAEAAEEETSDADEDDELTGAPAENDDDDDIRLF